MTLRPFVGLSLMLATMLIVGCAQETTESASQDIFRQDLGNNGQPNERRRPATDAERLWTISLGGCTGFLIAPELMMTAAHCSPRAGAGYRSGYAMNQNISNSDIRVQSVIERNRGLDYAIMRIRWNNGFPKGQKFPPRIPTSANDVTMGSSKGSGDEIFTVGFPADVSGQWGATFSQGRAKTTRGGMLYYNIGTINGNSGGGVWRKSDKMLVSMTNAGPHQLGQSGWRGGDAHNPRGWNQGVAMWEAYRASATLREVFPNGRNRYALDDGTPIFVALGSQDNALRGTYEMVVSVAEQVDDVLVCTQTQSACEDGNSNAYPATLVGRRADRYFYLTRGAVPLALDRRLQVVARKGAQAISRKIVEIQSQ